MFPQPFLQPPWMVSYSAFGPLVSASSGGDFTLHQLALRTQPSHLGVASVDNDLGRKAEHEHVLTNNQSTPL